MLAEKVGVSELIQHAMRMDLPPQVTLRSVECSDTPLHHTYDHIWTVHAWIKGLEKEVIVTARGHECPYEQLATKLKLLVP
jgi:hypothetical protein